MEKILITGSNGMLGKDLAPVLEDEGFDIIETTRSSLDITNFEQAKKILEENKPDYLVHCAAWADVDKVESDPEKAQMINGQATENLAKICAQNDIVLIYISSDYVFDGEASKPYSPSDKPHPINIYGRTKYEGELAVQKFCKKFYIARTSLLFGHYGANFVDTIISQADKPEVKVVDDQVGCPTWTVDLSMAIADLISEEAPYGIYHLCNKGGVSRFGLAQEVFKLLGKKVNLIPCKSDEFPRPAKRPKYSAMDNQGRCRGWRAALKDYISLR